MYERSRARLTQGAQSCSNSFFPSRKRSAKKKWDQTEGWLWEENIFFPTISLDKRPLINSRYRWNILIKMANTELEGTSGRKNERKTRQEWRPGSSTWWLWSWQLFVIFSSSCKNQFFKEYLANKKILIHKRKDDFYKSKILFHDTLKMTLLPCNVLL